jgi:ribosome-binding factor A
MKPKSSPRSGAKGDRSRQGEPAADKPHSGAPRDKRAAKGPSQRQLRVAEEIRHALAEIFLRTEFDDKLLHGVRLTVSEVRMSPDLKHAAVFCTKLGNQDVTPLLPALKRVSPFLRSQLAPKLGLRVTPDLKFLPDQALEEATRINKLLHAPEVARDLET